MRRSSFFLLAILFVLAGRAHACEPVLPFLQAVVPISLVQSLWWLLLAVIVKSLLFAWFQRSLNPTKSGFLMLLGNVLTTFIGVFVAALVANPGAWPVALPIAFGICWLPTRRFVSASPLPGLKDTGRFTLAFAMLGALVLSCFLFALGQGALHGEQFALYWALKILAIFLALVASMALTTVWEEWTIWRLGSREPGRNFFAPVLRANLYVMILILAMPAIIILPKRLKNPNFIAKRAAVVSALTTRH